ncbi:glycosyl transferase [Planctomycetota bacterium]|nr:glycosyl transferase [Planctomycetota bacterium]
MVLPTLIPSLSPAPLPDEILAGDGLLRAEIFSTPQLVRHGRDLAGWHRLEVRRGGNQLLQRLRDNESTLRGILERLVDGPASTPLSAPLVPAGDWLLDNQHLIMEQIATARRHLPRGYSRELPRLTTGDPAGAPRVYALSIELIAHADGRVDADSLSAFISAYQEIAPLTLGELWAVPIMLRLALIENLRRVAVRVAGHEEQRRLAALWAARLGQIADEQPSSLVIVISELARSVVLSQAFVAELHRRVQGLNPQVALVMQWLDQRLADHHQMVTDLVRADHQVQASDQLAVEHAITSLRRMATIDWRTFVEEQSPVEAVLRQDPVHPAMDPGTRDRYRKAIEGLARRCHPPGAAAERAVAEAAMALAQAPADAGQQTGSVRHPAQQHVGWWLIGDGRRQLEQHLAQVHGLRHPSDRGTRPLALAWFVLSILVLTAVLTGAAWLLMGGQTWFAVLVGILSVIPASQAAVAVTNWISTCCARAERMPRMDYSEGIPADRTCLVVVPCLLRSAIDVQELTDGLLVRSLANRESGLRFALLTDFADADRVDMPADALLLSSATAAIAALNRRHGDRFHLFHRPRCWNAGEGVFMGRERKRGKIEDLNGFLLRGERSAFTVVVGDATRLTAVRYVLVLDADTRLPRDAGRDLVAAMAHPLNWPVVRDGLVVAGHAILQPRIVTSLGSSTRSWFATWWSGEAGFDPYTRTVSDVYQDLFDQGSFIGKGIYDLAAFASVMDGRFPDNAILSHDLIEGSFARAGLISDVLLVEDHPARYLADVARRIRWIRGDWQLLPWLARSVASAHGHAANVLGELARWKILDNLRRSLLAAASVGLLAAVWIGADMPSALVVSAGILGLALLPTVLGALGILHKDLELPWSSHLRLARQRFGQGSLVAAGGLAVLPFEAVIQTRAVLRTMWRLLISHRHLQEWQTSSEAERLASGRLTDVILTMWPAPTAGVLAILLAGFRPGLGVVAVPLGILWILAPFMAWGLSRPRRSATVILGLSDRRYLDVCARKTWRFFTENWSAEDRYLPPDNVQDEPVQAIAHRTSPTNIGLALLADLAAHDLGWLTTGGLIRRLELTWDSTNALARHRGHLFNWYDTRTGQVLTPRYVSTVDSGNLAGHLLVLAAGLRALPDRVETARRRRGLAATLACAGTPQALALANDVLTCDLAGIGLRLDQLLDSMSEPRDATAKSEAGMWLASARQTWAEQQAEPEVLAADLDRARSLADAMTALALGMEWPFLYDRRTKLFAIGYRCDDTRLDDSSYDLLASESRLGSYVAIATGSISQDHWFHLGRRQVRTLADGLAGGVAADLTAGWLGGGGQVLVSWSGTLFEYLMPSLVMPEEPGTLIDDSNRTAVAEQIRYAASRGVPWGISESAYYHTDASLNWQYRAFGVPSLGMKRGLAEDLVVAPYACALGLLIDPEAAVANLHKLESLGSMGRFGFCDAIDFTPSRLPVGVPLVVIRSWMAHHQGMALLAFLHVLEDAPMRRRFLADPQLLAHRLLLEERPVPIQGPSEETDQPGGSLSLGQDSALRVITQPHPAAAEVQLLSNGRYHCLVFASGSGGSRWNDLSVTRWRADPTGDGGGPGLYLRDVLTGDRSDDHSGAGACWSACHFPSNRTARLYEAVFSQGRAEFRRRDGDLSTHTEIAISPEDDVELRRLHLANHGEDDRRLELTTYVEPVLAPAVADLSHPAFSNLFIETEMVPEAEAVLATRRPRHPEDARLWLVHLLVPRGEAAGGEISFETDRRAFLGRGGHLHAPQALQGPCKALGGTVGGVLDPVLALRRQVTVPAGGRIIVDVIYAVAPTRAAALALAQRYRDEHIANRVFGLAYTHGQVVLSQIGASGAEAQVFARLAGSLVVPVVHRRSAPATMLRNRRTRAGLWSYGISGDLPICLMRVTDSQRTDLVRQVLRAHAWWRSRGLAVDLVILIEDPSIYRQEQTERILGLVMAGPSAGQIDRPGGIFVRRLDQVPEEDRHLLAAVASLVIADVVGNLGQFSERRVRPDSPAPRFRPTRPQLRDEPLAASTFTLSQWNGLGGFTSDGREYIIILPPGRTTPLPWCNVLANESFGTVVSERGAAYTWAGNCHEFRLTPWRCDAVADPFGELTLIRDEDTGAVWSPTPGPLPGRSTRVVRHGFGYSAFMAGEEGLATELHTWVDAVEPVKHLRLLIANRSGRERRLTVTMFLEWTLGELRERTQGNLVTEHEDGVLFARNPLHDDESQRHAFLAASRRLHGWTCDRTEFLGRGSLADRPDAMAAGNLLGRCGAGFDPCAAAQVLIQLAPGEEQEVVFTIGCGRDRAHARSQALARRGAGPARESLSRVYEHWKHLLSTVQVSTCDPTINLLANGWLGYQIISARILARSGFSQSGGAWGFRDQLQDSMALVHHAPHFLKEQIRRCAGRQFSEGDVQHWWHPPQGRGVRTRISDDYLWLPYALCRYLETGGDPALLHERLPFLKAAAVPAELDSVYDLPQISDEQATIYQHAVRALLHGLRFGSHGLPLMGSGDWNDGMDRVGRLGRGESVWLGFFLIDCLRRFVPVAQSVGDAELSARLLSEAIGLRTRIEATAWEHDRYLRAWTDDGVALGSATSVECRIDALPQAWAALSLAKGPEGAGDPARARIALDTVERLLVLRDQGLILLFDPPFDHGPVEPGYIKGYAPGVRENGGQYTHAAVWTAMAFAALGDGAKALELTRLIDPIRHGADPDRWQGEPYVLAADVYRAPGHIGRAGWTWYTGSAGWMLRLILESLLGLTKTGGYLRVSPTTSADFGDFTVVYRAGTATYNIQVTTGSGTPQTTCDGQVCADGRIPLVEDGREHAVRVLR